MSKCLDTCKKPTPAQAHCASCHRHFGGITGFDKHRQGLPWRSTGPMAVCIDPATFGFVEKDGIWRDEMDHEKVKIFRDRVGR